MSNQKTDRICFVIAPIGPEGSDIRKRADQVFKYIISPAVDKFGYKPLRADQIAETGLITSQVIQHVIDDPLVIADLTGHNPNVFYELAIRHAIRKPFVQIIHPNEEIPFDVAGIRTVRLDYRDLESVDAAKKEIIKHIEAIKDNPEVDSPISTTIDLQSLRLSKDPLAKGISDIMAALQEIRFKLESVSSSSLLPRDSPLRRRMMGESAGLLSRLRETQPSVREIIEEVIKADMQTKKEEAGDKDK